MSGAPASAAPPSFFGAAPGAKKEASVRWPLGADGGALLAGDWPAGMGAGAGAGAGVCGCGGAESSRAANRKVSRIPCFFFFNLLAIHRLSPSSLSPALSHHCRYTGMLLVNASLSSARTAGPSGLEGVDSRRRRREPQPSDVRVSMPVVGFLPSAYRHSALCWDRSSREEEKSALWMLAPPRSDRVKTTRC